MSIKAIPSRAVLNIQKLVLWLFVENILVKTLRAPFVTTTIPAATGAYFTLFEFYGEKWPFFINYSSFHDTTIFVLIIATVIIALIKGLTDSYISRRVHQYFELLHNFIRMNGSIVTVKDSRFKTAAERLEPNDDVFNKITHPTSQINEILRHAEEFLIQNFSLQSNDNLRITLIEKNDENWHFSFDTHAAWNTATTDALELLTSESAASKCFTTGEPLLLPDKIIAEAKGEYILSERDKRKGSGSVYCYPVFVNCGGTQNVGIITIVTYNSKRLAKGYDQGEINQVLTILKEICRRIELEFTLKSIRSWSLSSSTRQELGG